MNSVSIPYHLLISLILDLSILVFLIVFRKKFLRKKYFKSVLVSSIVFFSIYAILVGIALYEDLSLQFEVNKFDLNKDGFFSSKEANIEGFEETYGSLINDVGRNFSIFISVFYSFLISTPILMIGLIIERMKKQTNSKSIMFL